MRIETMIEQKKEQGFFERVFGRSTAEDDAPTVTAINEVIVRVPDIKQRLVDEFERTKKLEQKIEYYERKLDEAKKTEVEYKATLVTLDEYCDRIERNESIVTKKDDDISRWRERYDAAVDEVNSYKIQFNTIARTKEDIRTEVATEICQRIVEEVKDFAGSHKHITKGELLARFTNQSLLESILKQAKAEIESEVTQ
jgi:DNA repair ATPase RecN